MITLLASLFSILVIQFLATNVSMQFINSAVKYDESSSLVVFRFLCIVQFATKCW